MMSCLAKSTSRWGVQAVRGLTRMPDCSGRTILCMCAHTQAPGQLAESRHNVMLECPYVS